MVESIAHRAARKVWIALPVALVIAYVSAWVFVGRIEDGYYNYYLYPHLKGSEYAYPQLRYTIGQIAILAWSLVGLSASILLARSALFGKDSKLAVRSVAVLSGLFLLLFLGFITGAALRDLGWR